MVKLARIMQVEHLGGLSLRLSFDDGPVRDLDLGPILHGGYSTDFGMSTSSVRRTSTRSPARVAWPDGFDFDPDVLHGDLEPASGPGPKVLAERHLRSPH